MTVFPIQSIMLMNYIKTALRSFRRNKSFSIINIAGLAFGLTCFILMGVFVIDELSFDRYADDANNIYRVHLNVTGNGDVAVYPNVDFAVGDGMKSAFPEIKTFTRISPATDFVKWGDRQFKETKLGFADSNMLQVFSIPLVQGSNESALVQPNSVVISKDFARKYFGETSPMGQSLEIGLNKALYKVTGVFDQFPGNSHFHFDAVLSMTTFKISQPTWSNLGPYTYLVLNKGADAKKLETKFPQLVAKYIVPEIQHDMGVSLAEAQKSVNTFVFTLQPLTGIHLNSHTKYEIEPNGDKQYVYIFSAIALFILLLACINFTNLSIARSAKRAKEVGVRKVMGSGKGQLVKQFLSESVLMSFCAMVLAFVLVVILLPYFNQLSGKQIGAQYFANYRLIGTLILVLLVVGIVSGVYPSLFLSSFNPIKVLKGTLVKGNRRNVLRSGLVVFQFFVSTALTMSTIIVYKQMKFMENKKLGYDKNQVLYLPDARLMGKNQDAFKQDILQDRRVVAASISRSVPGDDFMDGTEVHPVNDNGNGTDIHMNIYHVDYDYVKTLGIQLKRGRYFSPDFGSDSAAVVINEAAVRKLGWSNVDPVGRTIVRSGQQKFTVVGVLEDFHYTSARHEVAPLMMMLGRNYGGLVMKIKADNVSAFLNDLKTKWNSFNPQGPLSFTFLDDKFAALYASELRTQKIFSSFAVIAMLIAGLGLFGLSAYMIEQRTREIGIRKVLGASAQTIIFLVSKEFLLLVAFAFLISVPVTWWGMQRWLESYAYRIQIGFNIFLIAGLAAVLIAAITISFQTIRAAWMNPVNSLRSE